jgi:hypothetical protein
MHKLKYCLLVAAAILFAAKVYAVGEPVPGAEITVELAQPDGPVATLAHCQTNKAGEFHFTLPSNKKVPPQGVFNIKVVPPGKGKYGSQPQVVTVPYDLRRGMQFSYVLSWTFDRGQNRGSFAVSGKSST